jgi:hypothetical protein
MDTLRKIPLEMLIQILQDLFESGADYVDISGDSSKEGEPLRDSIKITIKPEYLSDYKEGDEDTLMVEEEIEIDFFEDINDDEPKPLSEEDINDLI